MARVIYGAKDKYYDIDAARRSVPGLISAYVSTTAEVAFHVVEGAGHYLPELVEAEPISTLMPEVLGR